MIAEPQAATKSIFFKFNEEQLPFIKVFQRRWNEMFANLVIPYHCLNYRPVREDHQLIFNFQLIKERLDDEAVAEINDLYSSVKGTRVIAITNTGNCVTVLLSVGFRDKLREAVLKSGLKNEHTVLFAQIKVEANTKGTKVLLRDEQQLFKDMISVAERFYSEI